MKSPNWTDDEVTALRETYTAELNCDLDIDGLAARLGRTRSAVAQKAHALGLTDNNRVHMRPEDRKARKPQFESAEARRAHQSEHQKKVIAERGHPRGMLGKHHSPETKERLRVTTAAAMASMSPERISASALKAMQTRQANGTGFTPRINASWKAGWRVIGEVRKFYRSRWEANYARYLQWLKAKGEIRDWKHEPKTFWFEGVRRGAVSYLPDFWVQEKNGAESYHEVKGWMDPRSETKLKRMAKYFPAVKLLVIREKDYRAIARVVAPLIPDWELGRKCP